MLPIAFTDVARGNVRRALSLALISLALSSSTSGAQQPENTVLEQLAQARVGPSRAALLEALKSPKAYVRGLAASQLAATQDIRAVPALREALRSEADPLQRLNIAVSLKSLDDPSGLLGLVDLCNDETVQPELRINAALQTISGGGAGCARSVIRMLALESNGQQQAAELFFLLDPRIHVDASAAGRDLSSGLRSALLTADAAIRMQAAGCIQRYGVRADLAALQTALQIEDDHEARTAMEQAIKSFT